ncbi:MAG: hypothetical protein ABIR47_01190 [Candidatus Kapaibacterium sp.]
MTSRFPNLAVLAIILPFLAACGREVPKGGSPEAQIEPASPTFNILNILKATGNKVEVTGAVSRPYFESKGTMMTVNGGVNLEVYEFDKPAEMEAAAGKISPDGMTIDGQRMEWPAQPHFYKTERVIILYLGNDADNARELEGAFGKQFAGPQEAVKQ